MQHGPNSARSVTESATDRVSDSAAREHRFTLRLVALYEAAKAGLVLILGLTAGLILRHDLVKETLHWLGPLGINAASAFGSFLLRSAGRAESLGVETVLALSIAYAAVRLTVAVGLWRTRSWGEWLGAASGMVYVPFELHAVWRDPGWFPLALLTANLAIVGYLCLCLHWRRQAQASASVDRGR